MGVEENTVCRELRGCSMRVIVWAEKGPMAGSQSQEDPGDGQPAGAA